MCRPSWFPSWPPTRSSAARAVPARDQHLFLLGLAIPLQATIIPIYWIITRLHMYDTLLALILPSIAFAIPLSVLILTNFIRDVPNELFESMRLDGCYRMGHDVAAGASR